MNQAVIRQKVLGMVGTNCYICMHAESKEAFIVDPADNAAAIIRMVSDMGAKPCAVLLTHGHFDHIGAADELRKMYEIPVYAHEAEEALLSSPTLNLSGSWASAIILKADHLLKDGDKLQIAGFTVKVLHTPGHTEGSCCYVLENEELLFSGDTLFQESVGRTDFPRGSASDLIRAIREKLMPLPDDVTVYTGHDESTLIGYERMHNPYL